MAKHESEACMPCRGTGKVVSNLGGESQLLSCPWCQGSGVRTAGVDAQAAWGEGEGAGGEAPAEPAADAVA
jgi:DnaJ-class molecular chaperone